MAHLNLTNVDISCVPGSDLAALASITEGSVTLSRGWLAAQPACDCDIGIGSWADVWLN